MEQLLAQGDLLNFKPYWDPILRGRRDARIDFLQRLLRLGLGGFRERIKGRVGIFFRSKKNGDQRMVVDARDPNQAHKRAPHTRLGTPATIGALDLSPQALAAVGADSVDAHVATIDLWD
eukprot:14440595-Heterocapsa_arctica.AAC.1